MAENVNKGIEVLEMDGVTITRDSLSYTVSGGSVKSRLSYFTSLTAALEEVDERLFTGRLSKVQEAKKNDLKSLIFLINEHKMAMHDDFKKLSRLQAIRIG